jgi:hypothetical protein
MDCFKSFTEGCIGMSKQGEMFVFERKEIRNNNNSAEVTTISRSDGKLVSGAAWVERAVVCTMFFIPL